MDVHRRRRSAPEDPDVEILIEQRDRAIALVRGRDALECGDRRIDALHLGDAQLLRERPIEEVGIAQRVNVVPDIGVAHGPCEQPRHRQGQEHGQHESMHASRAYHLGLLDEATRSGRRQMSSMDNRAYYDDFAGWYERERHLPYHRMLDDLEVELVERYATAKHALEVGCGTGLILDRVARFAAHAHGIDLSGGMLAKARHRGLTVSQASATDLPVASESVDVAYSFKVLAHIPDITGVMREMARVVRPGGYVLAEFYNARSLRRLVKAVKSPTAVSDSTHDEHVFTRYDDARAIRSYLPPELDWVTTRGIRVITPVAAMLRVPIVGAAVRWAEHRLADLPIARDHGGFLVAICRRR